MAAAQDSTNCNSHFVMNTNTKECSCCTGDKFESESSSDADDNMYHISGIEPSDPSNGTT